MDWSWFRSVRDLTRALPASDEDESAWAASLASTTALYGFACAVVLNLLHLVFWPTDRFLLFPSPQVADAVRWLRATTFVNHSIVAILLLVPALRRHAPWIFLAGCLLGATLAGHALARMGPLDQPYLHMSYTVPLVLNVVPFPPARRALLTPLLGATILLAYLATRHSELHSPFLGSTVGCMTFSVLASFCNGHLLYLLSRRSFLQDRALQRQAAELRTHRSHLEEQVAEQTAQIRRLAAHLEQAAEGERARLSRELHDELGQQLTGLRYSLAFVQRQSAAAPSEVQTQLTEMGATLTHLTAVVREIVTDLRPQILDERGLGAAVEWLVQRTEERMGLPCTLEATIDTQIKVDGVLSIAAFRIIQESLTNVVKHAQARHAQVTIGIDSDGVRLTVQDDGVGLSDKETGHRGMGLLGMRERARAHGGRLSIESRPGLGTEIRAVLPFSLEGVR